MSENQINIALEMIKIAQTKNETKFEMSEFEKLLRSVDNATSFDKNNTIKIIKDMASKT